MSNVLWRFFRRRPVRDEEGSSDDQALMASPPAPDQDDRDISTAPEPGSLKAANDSQTLEAANDLSPPQPASDPKPANPPSDKEAVELQIASLLSAWDKTSLCARREFLTRIDQRLMTTHRIRGVHAHSGGEAVTG
jgi:hypothetical protein